MPEVRTVSLPEVEYQLLRRLAFQQERTQQDVLAQSVRQLHEYYATVEKAEQKEGKQAHGNQG